MEEDEFLVSLGLGNLTQEDLNSLFGSSDNDKRHDGDPSRKKAQIADDMTVVSDKSNRFDVLLSNEELNEYSKGFVPKNTESNTKWAVSNFEAWREWHNKSNPGDPVPADLLCLNDSILLNKWLSLYVVETRKVDGSRFPSKSIDLLLAGIKRYMTQKRKLLKMQKKKVLV